jgi:hypothetical protein
LAGNDDDNELDALRRKRLEQIRKIAQGKIVELADKDNFLSVIEGNPAFRVFIHIYKDGDETSQTLNSALLELGSSTGLTSKM